MKKMTAILIGAGGRGTTYTDIMARVPEKFQVIAVAEPIRSRRDHIRELHNIPDEYCFEDYKPLLALGKIADLAIICTMDRDHFEPAMMAIDLGYDLLLEKPIAPTAEECVRLTENARSKGVRVLICTVLRYTAIFNQLKNIIDSGKIGRVMSINHEECVGNVHQSHSFVRGNWGNVGRSSNMLLQKSCHDLDILQWLIGKRCKKIQSFGTLSYFTEANAPAGAPDRCIEGCPAAETCPYNAVKLYYDDKKNSWFREASTKKVKPSDEDVMNTLKTTQYGKCVYKCNNDVVDHQVVNLEFENGAVASFNMCAFNKGNRFIRVMGTMGEIYGDMDKNTIEYYDFTSKTTTEINACNENLSASIVDGHGGGDPGIVNAFYKYVTEDYYGDEISEIGISVDNHIIAFAAEKSRLERRVIELKDYKREIGLK